MYKAIWKKDQIIQSLVTNVFNVKWVGRENQKFFCFSLWYLHGTKVFALCLVISVFDTSSDYLFSNRSISYSKYYYYISVKQNILNSRILYLGFFYSMVISPDHICQTIIPIEWLCVTTITFINLHYNDENYQMLKVQYDIILNM